jgi:hypothetical protein
VLAHELSEAELKTLHTVLGGQLVERDGLVQADGDVPTVQIPADQPQETTQSMVVNV